MYSQSGKSNVLTIENDFSTILKGSTGISVSGAGPTTLSTFDAAGKVIDLTIQNIDASGTQNGGDRVAKVGVGVSSGGQVEIGTLNLKMPNLPNTDGSFLGAQFEHYGVVAGSSVSSGESAAFSGMQSTAAFDSLDIQMSANNSGLRRQLINGIRAIQGAPNNSGNGSAGYVEVRNDLKIDIDAGNNDAIGIYVSGSEHDGIVPEVKIHNSDIKIKSTASRANAIRLGKTANVGTGEGRLTSTGHMEIDTLAAANSSAIAVIWQGATLNADADTSSTTIKAGREAITISGNSSQATDQTITSFNNLIVTTASQTASLIDVGTGQNDYRLNIRGADSNLTAADNGWLLDVKGGATNASTTTFDFADGELNGLVNKTASSTLDMTVRNDAVWNLQEKGGSANSVTSTFSNLDLSSAAQINAFGDFVLAGNIQSTSGILNLSDGIAGNTLTIKGNYAGISDAALQLDTFLGASGSLSDRLINDGGTISGLTLVRISNTDVADAGAATDPGHGIKVVRSINGGTTTDDAFALDVEASNAYEFRGRTVVGAGAYAYGLYKGANPSSSTPIDEYGEGDLENDWYLRSQLDQVDPTDPTGPTDPSDPKVPVVPTPPTDPLYQAGVPTYESYAQSLLGLNGVSSLQQRVGNRFWVGNGNRVIAQGADIIEMPYAPPQEAGALVNGNGVWGRIEGAHNKVEPRTSTSDTDYNQNVFKFQAGVDGMLHENENGTLIGGVFVQYVHGKTKTKSVHGDGEISTDGYGFGGTLTWYGNEGFYVDAQAQATWYDSDLSSRIANLGFTSGNDGFGYALSLESGKRFAIDPQWSVTPQAQLVYSHVDFDSFTDVFGAAVSLDRGESLQGRLGITLDHENSWQNAMGMTDRAHVYGIANLYYEFLSGTRVDVAGTSFASEKDRLWGGLGIGGSYNWNDDKYSIYGEGIVNTSLNNFGDSYTLKGNIGFRVKW
ncbi:autotransporter outer membrane beta-barrel domain-containing protein [Falsochrobactrum ovis]|uniref:autotransporter family protein n=1 Tax=Falsochrobactrum ovis TaxID=1293442 RepID=UPI001FE04E69|nr:autotransporter outer membrane beta-barrel domain-containing protein [Falsochrobactrum ovis]